MLWCAVRVVRPWGFDGKEGSSPWGIYHTRVISLPNPVITCSARPGLASRRAGGPGLSGMGIGTHEVLVESLLIAFWTPFLVN